MKSKPSLETLPNELLHNIVAFSYDFPPDLWIHEHDSLVQTIVGNGYISSSDKWRLPMTLGHGGFCRLRHLQNLALVSRRLHSFVTPLMYGFFSDCDHCLRPWEYAAEIDQPESILHWRRWHLNAPIAGSVAAKSALSKAIAHNSVRVAELLLYGGYTFKNDTVAPDPESASPHPLLQAATRGHLQIVKLIADRGDDLDYGGFFSPGYQRQRYKVTALWQAAKYGHEDIVRFLLSRGASWQPRGSQPHGPLWIALKHGRAHIIRLFAEMGLYEGLQEDQEAILPFVHLDIEGCVQRQQWLLRRIVDLMPLAFRSQLDERFRKHNVFKEDNDIAGAWRDEYRMAEVRNIDTNTLLRFAFKYRSPDLLRWAWFFGADLNALMSARPGEHQPSRIDRRPLMQAFSMPGSFALSMFSTLLDLGADPNTRPLGSKRTILYDAVLLADYDEAYKMSFALIAAGASVEGVSTYNSTKPLKWAVLGHAHPEIIQLLIGSGARTGSSRNNKGEVLYWALRDRKIKRDSFLWRDTYEDYAAAEGAWYPPLARRFMKIEQALLRETARVVMRAHPKRLKYYYLLDDVDDSWAAAADESAGIREFVKECGAHTARGLGRPGYTLISR